MAITDGDSYRTFELWKGTKINSISRQAIPVINQFLLSLHRKAAHN